MAEARKVKIITTGPILGSFKALQTRLNNLQSSKAGPFDLCFCTGPFFSRSELIDETEAMMRDGMPIPVYFCHIGEIPEDMKRKDDQWPLNLFDRSNQEDYENGYYCVAKNVFHLCGKSANKSITQTADIINIYLDSSFYLTIGFLPPNIRMGTEQSVPFEEKIDHPSFVGCDILLSSDWGQGMAKSPAISDQDKGIILGSLNGDIHSSQILSDLGSFDVAELVSKSRPRYHYAPTIYAGPDKESSNSANSLFFIQSLPYLNPPSAVTSGVRKQYHTSRFLALCPLIADRKDGGANGRMYKSMHALGLQPLWSMDSKTANALPEGPTTQSPYTDLAYSIDHSTNEAKGKCYMTTSRGVSEAQARRIISEHSSLATLPSGEQQYRWNTRNSGKRNFNETSSQSDMGMIDPNNVTLFLHGTHGDSLSGAPLTEVEISDFFKSFHCVRARFPAEGYGKPKSYCFLDFASHDHAKRYLELSAGFVSVNGVNLSLKWSSGKPIKSPPPPPPPPPGVVGIYPGPSIHPAGYSITPTFPFTKHHKRTRLSEADAADSQTLFVFLPVKPDSVSDIYLQSLQSLASISQMLMENAMNDGDNTAVTAETEPALRVTPRYPTANNNYGFLDFASHAAASIVLATLTGSIEGGDLLVNELKLQGLPIEDLHGAQLWWALSKNKEFDPKPENRVRHNFQNHHYPLDARTDCWFCLASPTCEHHLILNVYDTCYVTMPKGSLDDYHALIVPVNHVGIKVLDEEGRTRVEESEEERIQNYFNKLGVYTYTNPLVIQEIEAAKDKVYRHTKEILGKDIFFFERAFPTYRGYHPHLNAVPIERGSGGSVICTMTDLAKESSDPFVFEEITVPVNEELQRRRCIGEAIRGYFYAEFINCDKQSRCFLFVDVDKDNNAIAETLAESTENDGLMTGSIKNTSPMKRHIPLQFGRQVLAKIVGNPSLANWKNCVVSKEKEEQMTNQFRETFLKIE